MIKKLKILIIITTASLMGFCISCLKEKNKESIGIIADGLKISSRDSVEIIPRTLILTEYFIDSAEIGNRGKNKLEIFLYKTNKGGWVKINFFSAINEDWVLRNHFEFDKDVDFFLNPYVTDINNDSYNDFSYMPYFAARGSNELKRFFVYDTTGDSLVHIKNSCQYHNLIYNPMLKCLDSWSFSAGLSQSFMRIDYDSLFCFAQIIRFDIMTYDSLNIYERDSYGEMLLTKKHSISEIGSFPRYINYKPLVEYSSMNYRVTDHGLREVIVVN